MLFNSYAFIFAFLPITLIVFFSLTRLRLLRAALLWLMAASLFFYGYWKPIYLPLMLVSIGTNYFIGRRIEGVKLATPKAKTLLIVGVGFNLALLGYYKYADFFLSSLGGLLPVTFDRLNIFLPLAISFYTFTQIAYLVDAYRGETKEYQYDLFSYTLFISFFPQLIAGPILRYNELLPQFRRLRNFCFNPKNMAMGVTLFILGLFKKVAIADNLSPWVAPVFDNASNVTFLEAWVGALAYTFQLYFDFSGYSDMAIGLGWMFNINLPLNFNSPYKSISIIDFWRRWHITLSHFLRDYLYIPLGGNRLGKARQYANLILTMLLGGLWHGAGWTFIIWGGLHGLFLVINHLWRRLSIVLPKMLGWILTFVAVVNSWVVFRAPTFSAGGAILQTMWGIKPLTVPSAYQGLLKPVSGILNLKFQSWQDLIYFPELGGQKSVLVLLGLLIFVVVVPNTHEVMNKFKPSLWIAIAVGTLATFCFLSLNRVSEFLYFQF
ncbi:MAG: MBOAT family O-acyltransferase [Cyanobacteriota bacterium]|nr:MBOAT family O-acyltransferase [Cyanobacteriota bacterium]